MADKKSGDKPAEKKKEEPFYESASATILAQQDSNPVEKKQSAIEMAEWGVLKGHLESHLIMLRQWRQSWWSTNWSNLAQYIDPRRSIWLTQSSGGFPSPNNMGRGKPINNAIVDPTGTYAMRTCAAGLMGGLASPSRPWFKFTPRVKTVDLDADARLWIDEVESRVYTVLAGSNFYNSFYQECEDNVVFGTGPCIIYEDQEEIIRCYNPAVGEYYLSSGATMRIDGLYRAFVMTVKQMVDFFGADNCPAEVQKLWAAKGAQLEIERIVAHSIEPNYGIGKEDVGQIPGKYTWREVYWVYGSNSAAPLSMRGFFEAPFMVSRWATQSNDAYGRSVGMDVLPDIIQLQVETLRKAEGIEKQVRPPLLADMQLKNQPSSSLPGHVTYVSNLGAGTGMRPIYEVNPDLNAMMLDLKEIQARIKTGFFNDLFLMLEQAQLSRATTVEIAGRMSEKLQLLGPVIENIITESLRPRLRRIYQIMLRKGMIPPQPASIRGMPMDVDFVSMLVLAQKAAATGGIERLMALIGNMVAVYPEARDNINSDEVIREMSSLLGNPQKILNSEADVKKARIAQQKAVQQAQQQQALAQTVNTMKTGADAASVLSNTQIGGGRDALAGLFGG